MESLVLERYGPADYHLRGFHCFNEIPLEWRMTVATDIFEEEVSNGGLAQFLWNVFYHYKTVLRDAGDGYQLVGATRHAAAINSCRAICSRFEQSCARHYAAAIESGDDGLDHFDQWYEEAERPMHFPDEELFYCDAPIDVVAMRGRWILAHFDRYAELLSEPGSMSSNHDEPRSQ